MITPLITRVMFMCQNTSVQNQAFWLKKNSDREVFTPTFLDLISFLNTYPWINYIKWCQTPPPFLSLQKIK